MALGLAVLFVTGCSHERQITVKDKDGNVIAGTSESEESVFDSEEEWLAYMTKDRSNYITVKGENTTFFLGQLDNTAINAGLDVTGVVVLEQNRNYQNQTSVFWTIEEKYFVTECKGEYYMAYVVIDDENSEITDNIGDAFQKLVLDGGGTYYAKYIDCPIKDYEFYVDGKKLNMRRVE